MPKKKTENSSSRGYSPRKIGTREVKERFLIVCEGEKTEPNYFRCFRVPGYVLEIKEGKGSKPTKLIESAEIFSKEDEYDQVWCVFDRDSWTLEDFNNAIQNAEHLGFKVAYSNEAFELWYVLHFEFLNTGIPRKDYQDKLSKHLGKTYQKNSETIYEDLLKKQIVAIKNAGKLLKQYDRPNPAQDNPSTAVHLLVQELSRWSK